MPSPPIQVFLTTIASQPALRQRQEYILRILHVKKIPFTSYDLASDEAAKKLWRRKAPADKQQLPGILVGGVFRGTYDQFEEAVEYDELSDYLRLNESYDPKVEEDRPLLPQQVIGVPGAASHAQMTPEHHKPAKFLSSDSPRGKPVNKRDDEFDVSAELEGYGLQGVKVTEDDLAALVQELGLGGDEADDLVRGLSTPAPASKKEDVKKADPQAALMAELSAKIKPAAKAPAEAEKPKPSEESVPTEPKPVEENVGTKSEETDTTETKPKEEAVFKKEETPEAPSSEKVEEVLSKATEEIKVAETKVAEETKQTEEAKKPEETKAAEELKETAEITKTEPDAKAAV